MLDFTLGKVAKRGMSLDDSAKLKRALGLPSKSIVQEWKTSGVGGVSCGIIVIRIGSVAGGAVGGKIGAVSPGRC